MSYVKPDSIDNTVGGDQVNEAVMKNDNNIDEAFRGLNEVASNQTDDKLLTAMKRVDGHGSGLDADTVDGLHGADLSLSGHTHPVVTNLANGLMLAADKARFDTMSGDMSDQQILDAIKRVDGSGSGLDADLLDGQHSTYFSPTTHNHNSLYSVLSHIHPAVTTSANGFMSSSDKTKLNGIPSGGGTMTDAEILAAVKRVDGSGSGLDADLLDGHHASYFSPSTHNHNTLYSVLSHAHSAVTTSVNGFMSSADKVKLNGIPSGGGTMTDAEILAAIKRVDGSGSGLDADLLDNHHASYFSPSTHNHSGVYLPVGGTAANSLSLGGDQSSVSNVGDSIAKRTSAGNLHVDAGLFFDGEKEAGDSEPPRIFVWQKKLWLGYYTGTTFVKLEVQLIVP